LPSLKIGDAAGLARLDAIAAAASRLEALVFGPADFMASPGMHSLEIAIPRIGTLLFLRGRLLNVAAHAGKA
jgi:citrate lyase beta subunit